MLKMDSQNLIFRYRFDVEDGSVYEKVFLMDPKSLTLVNFDDDSKLPEWARLEVDKCSHCPLDSGTHTRCPIAAFLAPVVERFKNTLSTTRARITVGVTERYYFKETTVQEGLFSLFGFVMATAGCPHMSILKPLARFHLPFASLDENLVRSVSMYLIRQYFQQNQGQLPDWDLQQLPNIYSQIETVNKGISKRIRAVLESGEAPINGLVALDSIAKMLSLQMQNDLKKYASLFDES